MQTSPSHGGSENDMMLPLVVLSIVALLCWLYFADFVRCSCWALYWLWKLSEFPRIHYYAAERINLLAETYKTAASVTLSQWTDVMNRTAGILFVPMLPLIVLGAWAIYRHPALGFRSRRFIDAHTLPRIMARFAPTIIPVLAGHKADGLMNDTSPEHAWALKPEEFAAEHNLVRGKVLDRDAARRVFDAQTGPKMILPSGWQAHERALLAVFGLQVFADDRKAATRLLDDLNRSCMVRRLFRSPEFHSVPDWKVSERHVARVLRCPGVKEWLDMHCSVRTALAGLYGRRLRLSPARFRWLKGLDRTLWYGLNTADVPKVFAEGAGIVAQARAEQKAARLKLPPPPLMTDEAIHGLQAELELIGEVYPREASKRRSKRRRSATFPDALYSPSESEFDPVSEGGNAT
ncbi:conjugal transfer protein [Pantoea ananatis 15320]|uniref:secretion/conjugation apparatus DotM-related subunit n=1 Tax=Pantoea ananas TaxID=553 RepID=UPI00041C2EB3|nr:hypothetical protein [Pantoea ananatis]PKC36273.1 conjugal transfer protein [Pantoea ananatis 15320]